MRILSLVLAGAAVLSFTQTSKAQFDVGDNVAQLGVGFGGYYTTSTSATPLFSLSYERGVTDLGPGVLGIGGFVGYKSVKYDYNYAWYNYDWKYTYFIIGARGQWHYNEWHGNPKLDTYGGLILSYNSISSKVTYSDPNVPVQSNAAVSSGIDFGLYVGTRYWFSDAFGAYGELGWGPAILNLGLAYKF